MSSTTVSPQVTSQSSVAPVPSTPVSGKASVSRTVLAHVRALPVGEPFTVGELLSLGPRASVDQALSRLVKTGVLTRVVRGVYMRPKLSPWVGAVSPSAESVVEVLASRTGDVVVEHGAQSALRLGLSTGVPVSPVFLTSGRSRVFNLGGLKVSLKHVSSRKLALGASPAGSALRALWFMGEGSVGVLEVSKVASTLSEDDFQLLVSSMPLMPSWLRDVFREYLATV